VQWKTIELGKNMGVYPYCNNPILISVPFKLSTFLPTVLSHLGVYSSQASLADCLPFVSCNNVDVTNKSFFWHNRLGHSFSVKNA